MIRAVMIAIAALVAAPAAGSPPVVAGAERLAAGAAAARGRVLIGELNCAACHDAGPLAAFIEAKPAPDLARVGERVKPAYLERFIADPSGVKPGTTMPHVMAGLDDEARRSAAKAISHFLRSPTGLYVPSAILDAEASRRGHKLFNSVGCVACHNPRDADGTEQPIERSVPLGAVQEKYDYQQLAWFLVDPLSVRPGGRMPDMQLSPWEARDLAAFLTQGADGGGAGDAIDADLARKGRVHFVEFGCANCHTLKGVTPAVKGPALAGAADGRGCLSDHAGKSPRYRLSADQRRAITAAIGAVAEPPTLSQRIEQTLASLNCVACHQRGELGGVTADRLAHFHSASANLGEQGRIPPPLTGVGAKLRPEALRRVLVAGESVRPYVKTRMPRFGRDNVAHLVERFAEADGEIDAPAAIAHHGRDALKPINEAGHALVGDRGLNCVACHTFRDLKSATMPAMDLTVMAGRLRREWLHAYLIQPQRFSPSTLMPSFWPDGRAARADVLDGDTDRQIDAIWNYLSAGGEARVPSGLAHEPLILTVGDEAVLLRRQYNGVGKRGIGVGYPAGVNLVFDAEQMRLSEIWKGAFADVGAVWRGQGAGSVRPLGEKRIALPQGGAFTEAEAADIAWPEQAPRDAGIRFKGYTLDAKRRPSFAYRIGDIAVTDAFIDEAGEAGDAAFLRRTLTFDSPREAKLVMRLAAGRDIAVGDGGVYVIDKALTLRVTGAGRGIVAVEGEKAGELRIPIGLKAGRSVVVIEYHW